MKLECGSFSLARSRAVFSLSLPPSLKNSLISSLFDPRLLDRARAVTRSSYKLLSFFLLRVSLGHNLTLKRLSARPAGLQQGQALARMMPGAENRSSRASGRGASGGEGDCGGTAEFLELSSKSSENDSGSSPPQSTLLSVSGVRGGGGGGGGGGGCGRRDSTGGAARKDSGGGYLLGGGSLPVGRGAADAAADGAKRMLFHLSNSELRQK